MLIELAPDEANFIAQALMHLARTTTAHHNPARWTEKELERMLVLADRIATQKERIERERNQSR